MDRTRSVVHEDGATYRRSRHTILQRLRAYLRGQRSQVHGKTLLAYALCAPLPKYVGAEIRAAILRRIGFTIGANSGFFGTPTLFGTGDYYKRLVIGSDCWINLGCYLELNALVQLGDHVNIGPDVMILTGSHEMGTEGCRAGRFTTLPVTIDSGAWIGARCVILPGVTIGKGAVIAAGTTVHRDVPPNIIMIGTQGMPIDKWMALTKAGAATR